MFHPNLFWEVVGFSISISVLLALLAVLVTRGHTRGIAWKALGVTVGAFFVCWYGLPLFIPMSAPPATVSHEPPAKSVSTSEQPRNGEPQGHSAADAAPVQHDPYGDARDHRDSLIIRDATLVWVAPEVFVFTMVLVISILAFALRRTSLWIYSAALLIFGMFLLPASLWDFGRHLNNTPAPGYGIASGLFLFAITYLWFGVTFLEISSIPWVKLTVFVCIACMFGLQIFKVIHVPILTDLGVSSILAYVVIGILAIQKARTGFRPAPYLAVGSFGIAVLMLVGTEALFALGKGSTAAWVGFPWTTAGLVWQTVFVFVSISDGIVAANRKALVVTERYAEAARRFVPDDFLRALGHVDIADVQLGDRVEREMAVLFSDIRSFTSLSETMSPGQTMTFVNEYLAYAGPTIREHGGFIDKYIGDAIMALFEDPDGALKAAIGLQESLHRFNEVRLSHGESPISIGVGVHAGTLMLGTVGEERRIDTTVIADAVNVASRVEGLTKEYHVGIVVTDDLVKRLKGPPETLRLLGETQVTGLERAIRVYACEPHDGTALATVT